MTSFTIHEPEEVSLETEDPLLFRMLDVSTHALNAQKQEALAFLRTQLLQHANHFVQQIFAPEPLLNALPKSKMNALLLPLQKATQGVNKAYVEKAR
ncbi:MAG: hypothetical protein AAGJ35_03855, partial [Myxococcota bacterium]